ncbi:MAG: LLM class flavin-dependent oxidoreductase [Gammaproteobacteria bacterium]
MRFALGLANAADSWRTAVRAEELGFDTVWFEDSQMVAADPFVVMAAAAMKTTRIRLGTGVCIPTNRIPPVTANVLASLNALAPGRIDFGVGTGFSARRAMGLPAISVATLGRHLRAVRGLLDGDTVEWSFDGQRRKLRFVNADLGLFNVDDPIEFHVAAMGPRTRALTADTGSHWIAVYMHPAQAAAEIAEMNQAYADAGEDPARFRKTAYTFGAVLRDNDSFDAPRIRQQAGPVAAMVLHNLMETQYGDLGTGGIADEALVEAYRHIYEAYEPADARYLSLHRGHALFLKPEEEAFVTGDFIRQCSFSGTAEALADQVKGMRDAGYTDVSFVVLPQYPEMVEDWARVRDLAAAG